MVRVGLGIVKGVDVARVGDWDTDAVSLLVHVETHDIGALRDPAVRGVLG